MKQEEKAKHTRPYTGHNGPEASVHIQSPREITKDSLEKKTHVPPTSNISYRVELQLDERGGVM